MHRGLPNSDLYFCTTTASSLPDVAVKAYPAELQDGAEREFVELLRLEAILGSDADCRGIRPLGWTSLPATLWTEYVPGTDLRFVLRDPDQAIPRIDELREWIRKAGRALGLYHAASLVPEDSLAARSLANSDVATRTKLVGPRNGFRPEFLEAREIVKWYMDFSPTNMRMGDDGLLYLLDPPTKYRYGFRHRDVGRFIGGLMNLVFLREWRPYRRSRQLLSLLVDDFLNGYETTALVSLRTAQDLRLVATYEMARRVWLTRTALRRRDVRATRRHLRALVTTRSYTYRRRPMPQALNDQDP